MLIFILLKDVSIGKRSINEIKLVFVLLITTTVINPTTRIWSNLVKKQKFWVRFDFKKNRVECEFLHQIEIKLQK